MLSVKPSPDLQSGHQGFRPLCYPALALSLVVHTQMMLAGPQHTSGPVRIAILLSVCPGCQASVPCATRFPVWLLTYALLVVGVRGGCRGRTDVPWEARF